MINTHHTFSSRGNTLAATLTTPDGQGPFPAALLVAGSGPLDRDGDHKRMKLGLQRDLAELLAEQGWATFRYDKAGVGESQGDYLSTGLFDELADVRAALNTLRGLGHNGTLIAVGHSAGSLMAAELASREQGLAGIVLLSTTTDTGEEVLIWQATELEAHAVPKFALWLMRVFRTSVAKQQRKTLDKIKASPDDVMRIQGQKINAKWMREFMAYDPKRALAKVAIPVLAMTGSKDTQVSAANLKDVARICKAWATVVEAPSVDHILRVEPAEFSSPQHYKKLLKTPIADAVRAPLLAWLREVVTE